MTQAPHLPTLEPPVTLDKELSENEQTLLTVHTAIPHLSGSSVGIRRINRYYTELARQWQHRWETTLLSRAKEGDTALSRPWAASFGYQVTLLTPDCLSLYWEVSENTGGRRPRKHRQGDIWLLPHGTPISPSELFAPLGRHWRKTVLTAVEEQITARMKDGDCVFFEHHGEMLPCFLRAENFYRTEEGICFFCPIDTIAPAFEGFPVFALPFPDTVHGTVSA